MNNKLKEIKQENITVFIYFILLILYLYANKIEIDYLNTKDDNLKENYRLTLYIVFGISFLITLYYTIDSIKELGVNTDNNIYKLKELSTIANILILVATAMYLYIIYKDENIDLEISP